MSSSHKRLLWAAIALLFVVLVVVSCFFAWTAMTLQRAARVSPSIVRPAEKVPAEDTPLVKDPAPVEDSASKSDDLSTVLNTRYEDIEETTCLKEQSLSLISRGKDWDPARAYLEGMFGAEQAVVLERGLESALSEEPEEAVITSLCKYAEDLYVTELRGSGEEFEGYRAFIVTGANELYLLGEFIVPLGRAVGFSTVLFEDDTLGMYARAGDASYTSWYYYRVTGETDGIEQVEWCDRYYGGGWSPYGDEPTLVCEYTYTP